MSRCCAESQDSRARTIRRGAEASGWLTSGALLVLMPKCPACIAGYVMLFTGVGPSLPAAAAGRWVLIALCISALLFLALRTVCRRF